MLTKSDVKKIVGAFKDVALEEIKEPLEKKFSELQSVVDGISKKMDNMEVEKRAITYRLGLHENWIQKAANETDIPYNTEDKI